MGGRRQESRSATGFDGISKTALEHYKDIIQDLGKHKKRSCYQKTLNPYRDEALKELLASFHNDKTLGPDH